MQLTRDSINAKYQIRKYSPGSVTVNAQDYTSSILLMPDLLQPWSVSDISQLQTKHISEFLEFQPDIILLGTGTKLTFIDQELLTLAQQQNVGIELMTTAAACRTYSVLVAEQRRVLAALVI
jgi:uncharacterized protein